MAVLNVPKREGYTPVLVTAQCVCGYQWEQKEPKLPEYLISALELIKATPSISLASFLATKSLQDHLQEEKEVKWEP